MERTTKTPKTNAQNSFEHGCWCCAKPLGQCKCDYENDYCQGCDCCNDHCKCKQLNDYTIKLHEKEQKPTSGCTIEELAERMGMKGLSKNETTDTNDKGGRQSKLPYRADLLPPAALLALARVLKEGADKYGDDNWRLIPRSDHVNHAYTHLLGHLMGDMQDEHLLHAACRLLFALETE